MKVRIVGSGSWATALAQVLVDNGVDTLIYGISKEEVNDINENHQNSRFFDCKINEAIKASNDISVLKDADVILLGVPTTAMESVLLEIKSLMEKKYVIINVAKGFHIKTKERMSVLIKRILGNEVPVISLIGPSHAEEVILRQLTVVNAVCEDLNEAKKIQDLFSNEYFRVYINDDVTGAEIAAAVKNVMAIASGCLEGIGQGDNARAALITRGLHEMTRFGLKLGGRQSTFIGLNGVGDLVVTASSRHSRNFEAGLKIGLAHGAKEFMATNSKTVEGINATKTVVAMAKELGIEMPICQEVYAVLFEDKDPEKAISDLMSRPLKIEYEH